jgi:sodium-dependent dicarboxylate transporter 2/3/5
MGGFAIARTITVYRLDERIAKKIVMKASGKPLLFLISIVIVTAFLSMWMSNTATAALMLAVPLPILRKMDVDDKFRMAVILAVPFAANIGGIGTPIGTPPNAIALSQLKSLGIDISFAKWFLISLPILLITLIFLVFVLYKLFPPKQAKLPEIEVVVNKLTGKQLLAIGIIALTVVLWLTTPIHGYSSYLIALIPIVFVFGSGMLKTDHFQQLGWNVLVLIGGGTALGYAISQTKLDVWIINRLGLDAISPMLAIIIAAVMSGLLSNFISNTSTAALVVPIVLGLSSIDPILGAVGVAIGASTAMILPISTPPNAIAYSSDMIEVKDMIKGGSFIFIFMMLVVILHTIFIWKWII